MTGLATSSSSFNYQWTYDVFINFRGEDTRYGFIGNLYNALKNAGVHTFLDDVELRRGDEITPELLKAIENSRMAITVFSKNYAYSTFCLKELVKIHQCINGKGRLILPIFYDVEPRELRCQEGCYEQALSEHRNNLRADEDEINSWKLTLQKVSTIAGYHLDLRKNGYEYEFIERIVKEISSKINRVLLDVSEYPVGLESRVKEIVSLLQLESNDKVIMVGICGMGGLGKTTTARALYNSIADNFESLCFLHDVNKRSKKHGLEKVQETIISNILGMDMKIQDVNDGVQVMKNRFKEKKILLILDNIDDNIDKDEQLKKLAGDCIWFGGGSRIIITTRNRHLLERHGVECIYNMEVFNPKESLELLRWNAFRNRQVDPCYNDVLNRARTYAQGLPLALNVIGSKLYGKTINEWESALDVYEKSLHIDIEQVLRLSYKDLGEVEKEIFLDIACFFEGKELEYVKYMVEAVYDFNNLSYFIGVLVDKCLIKIEKSSNHIQMHDLIRDMGRKIVNEESPNNPGEQSRLWFNRDIVNVLERNTGTNKVRMIVQDNCWECIKVNCDGEAFKSMKELKILILVNVEFLKDFKYLPESLKVLKWESYPSSCLPPNFSPKELVVLDIEVSCLSSLETIIKTSNNLGILNLTGCDNVKEIPDLSNLRNLKELDLEFCENLIGIHDSIGYLPKLEVLNVEYCSQLGTFPRAIKLPSLRKLILTDCVSLKYFPEILEKGKITELSLENTGIEKLPWSICNLSELRKLWIAKNEQVIEIPNSIFLLPEIQEITVVSDYGKVIPCNSKEAKEMSICSKKCPNRVVFVLPDCNISDDILRTDLSRFMNVEYLELQGNDFTILPAWMKECHFLETLVLNECHHLREVEGIPPRIRRLEARNCLSLSLESKSMILSEELHGAPDNSGEEERWFFYVPSRSIPKWFDHTSKGASISFWFRNSFPTLCLCHLLKKAEAESFYCSVWVDINEETAFHQIISSLCLDSENLDDDHLVVYILKWDDTRNFWRKRLRLEHWWYHAQVCLIIGDKGMVIEESGMYVIKQLYKMEDVSFTNPYHQILNSTWGNQEASLLDFDLNVLPMLPSTEHTCETFKNQGNSVEDDEWLSLRPSCETPFYDESSNHQELQQRKYLKFSNVEQVPKSIEDDEWLSLHPCRKTPFYDESANNQELQRQKNVTSTNVEGVPKSFEETRKVKGKEIAFYDDTINN